MAMPDALSDTTETQALLEQLQQGDRLALDRLLARYRPQLRDFIEFHLDPAIRGRVDASDVIQETHMEVVRRIDDFLSHRPMPFRLWLRKKAYERLLNLRRDHRRERRSVEREVAWPVRSSLLLVKPLLDRGQSPSKQMEARELAERVAVIVARLPEGDREILLLRQAEELPFDEIACLLDIEPATARKRFGRALIRIQKALADDGLVE
jgi:RNA polymerase sigma-70 factor (ECF subfamily)